MIWATCSIIFQATIASCDCPPALEIRPCFCSTDSLTGFISLECHHRTGEPISEAIQRVSSKGVNVELIEINSDWLREIDERFFGTLPVKLIRIKAPQLHHIDENTFHNQKESLMQLHLTQTNLKSLPLETISFLEKLDTLEVSFSNLEVLPSFGNMSSAHLLKKLYLNNNYVTTLFNNTFGPELTSLQLLDLSHNKIDEIESPTFLQGLPISHLYLQNNRLTEIPKQLQNLENRAFVNMESNLIEEMDKLNLLKLLNKNIYTEFEGNPTKCDCSIAFLVVSHKNIYGKCVSPSRLTGKYFYQLTLKDFSNC
ncbi:Leucine-rich repeats and immunoglobulin-like domains protein 3 [Nymphon striatum]|nr:Leucine-rich repeats and immunoglobulin-like domains protein 3 [Nymphon striatum]